MTDIEKPEVLKNENAEVIPHVAVGERVYVITPNGNAAHGGFCRVKAICDSGMIIAVHQYEDDSLSDFWQFVQVSKVAKAPKKENQIGTSTNASIEYKL